jgi:hypothetical protein
MQPLQNPPLRKITNVKLTFLINIRNFERCDGVHCACTSVKTVRSVMFTFSSGICEGLVDQDSFFCNIKLTSGQRKAQFFALRIQIGVLTSIHVPYCAKYIRILPEAKARRRPNSNKDNKTVLNACLNEKKKYIS